MTNEQTETAAPGGVHTQVIELLRRVNYLKKTEHNPAQNFNFRGIDGVHNAFGAAMREIGLVEEPRFTLEKLEDVQTARGALGRRVVVKLEMWLRNDAGERAFIAETFGEAIDYGDKALSKAQSVAVRQAYIYAFALPTQEPDPDYYSHELTAYSAEDAKRDAVGAKSLPELRVVWNRANTAGVLTDSVKKAIDLKREELGGGGGNGATESS